jgi:hypothetical protein
MIRTVIASWEPADTGNTAYWSRSARRFLLFVEGSFRRCACSCYYCCSGHG